MKIRKHNVPIFTFYELSICFTLFVLLILARIIDLTPLTVEDGIIEYISAFFWFCGFVVSIVYLIQRRKSIMISILCIVCFVSLGEEISWGQRILSIETPKNIAAMNRQSEINLHNMYMLSPDGNPWRNFFKTGKFHYKQLLDAQNLFRMGFLVYFLVFPIFMKFGICSKVLSKMGYQMPPSYFLILLWFFITFSFVITIDLNTVIDKERFLAHCVQEIREMSYSIFITVLLIFFGCLLRECIIQIWNSVLQAIIKQGCVVREVVPSPIVSDGAVLIKVVNSCISAGTEISSVQVRSR